MADFTDKKDSQSLPDIVEQTCENLQSENIAVEQVLADTNYSSGDALKYLEDKNITGYIPNFGLYKPYHESFTYYPEGDYYQYYQGIKLLFKGIRKRSDYDKKVKQYWTFICFIESLLLIIKWNTNIYCDLEIYMIQLENEILEMKSCATSTGRYAERRNTFFTISNS